MPQASWCWCSVPGETIRLPAALPQNIVAVVLRIDSPGGDALARWAPGGSQWLGGHSERGELVACQFGHV